MNGFSIGKTQYVLVGFLFWAMVTLSIIGTGLIFWLLFLGIKAGLGGA